MEKVYQTGKQPATGGAQKNASVRSGVTETRLRNVTALVDEACGGKLVNFAERMGMSKSQVSHIAGRNPIKGIGHEMARHIEAVFGLANGTLDIEAKINAPRELVDVNQLPDAEALIHRLWLERNWAGRIAITNAKNIAVATGHGDAMAPTIMEGSVLLVDTGIKAVKADAIYVLSRASNFFVRRVHRQVSESLRLGLDNPRYDAENVDSLASAGLVCVGRVVHVWNHATL